MAAPGDDTGLRAAYSNVWDLDGDATPSFECTPHFGKTRNDLASFTISCIPYLTLNCVQKFCATYNIYAIATFTSDFKLADITFSRHRPPPHINFADATPLASSLMEKIDQSSHYDSDRVRSTTHAIVTSVLAHITPESGAETIKLSAKHYTATLIVKTRQITSDQIKSILNIDGVVRLTCSDAFYTGISVEFNIRPLPGTTEFTMKPQVILRRQKPVPKVNGPSTHPAKSNASRSAIRRGTPHPSTFIPARRIQSRTDVFAASLDIPATGRGNLRSGGAEEAGEEEEEAEEYFEGTEEEDVEEEEDCHA